VKCVQRYGCRYRLYICCFMLFCLRFYALARCYAALEDEWGVFLHTDSDIRGSELSS